MKSFGTLWHLGLFVWSLILIVMLRTNAFTWVRHLNNGLFIFSVLVLLLYSYFLKNFNIFRKVRFRKVLTFAKLVLLATTPAFFVLNMWIPLQRQVMCTFSILIPSKYDPSKEICPYISVLLASVFTVLVMVHKNKDSETHGIGDENQSANPEERNSIGEAHTLDNSDES